MTTATQQPACRITLRRHLVAAGVSRYTATVRIPLGEADQASDWRTLAYETERHASDADALADAQEFAGWKGFRVGVVTKEYQ